MLRIADWWLDTDVSEQAVGPISRPKQLRKILNCLILEMGPTACSETSVSNHQSELRKGPGVSPFSVANDRLAATIGPGAPELPLRVKLFLKISAGKERRHAVT
jgi:hypothetical protein